jgi:hypothetical protein
MPLLPPEKRYQHLWGSKHGEWTVLSFHEMKKYPSKKNPNKVTHRPYVYCVCSCGAKESVQLTGLLNGRTKRCGICNSKDIKAPQPPVLRHDRNHSYKGTKDISGEYFSHVLHGANKRKIEFLVSIQDLQDQWNKQQGKCVYTNIELQCLKTSTRKFLPSAYENLSHKASLDRIDSNDGYTKENIQWVSSTVNVMKSRLSNDLFLKIVGIIYKVSVVGL